jgi:hypothetical protein
MKENKSSTLRSARATITNYKLLGASLVLFFQSGPQGPHGVAHTGGAAGSIVERTRQHSK